MVCLRSVSDFCIPGRSSFWPGVSVWLCVVRLRRARGHITRAAVSCVTCIAVYFYLYIKTPETVSNVRGVPGY